jgi:hypothetical protein
MENKHSLTAANQKFSFMKIRNHHCKNNIKQNIVDFTFNSFLFLLPMAGHQKNYK